MSDEGPGARDAKSVTEGRQIHLAFYGVLYYNNKVYHCLISVYKLLKFVW